jgi:hypothetical protein
MGVMTLGILHKSLVYQPGLTLLIVDLNDPRENEDQKTARHGYVLHYGAEDDGWSAIWAQNFGLLAPVAPSGHIVMGISKYAADWVGLKRVNAALARYVAFPKPNIKLLQQKEFRQ